MKTTKYYLMTGVLALSASCSSDLSDSDGERMPVKLSYTVEAAIETRAAAGTNINKDYIMAGKAVTVRVRTGDAGNYTDYAYTTAAEGVLTATAEPPYYPASGTIDVLAYYPSFEGESFSIQTDQTTDGNYAASDLMWATPVTGQSRTESNLPLQFGHKMAKVIVNVTAGDGISQVNSVTLKNVKPTVTFNKGTGTVSDLTGSASAVQVVKSATDASVTGAAVIPAQTIDGQLLTVGITKSDATTGTATYTISNKPFTAGSVYTMNITVSRAEVGVETAVTGWTEGVTVTIVPGGGDNAPEGVKAVDLGLSVKWANMNVGAITESGYGDYFAWGETSPKEYYAWIKYAWCQNSYSTLTKYCPTSKQGSYWYNKSGTGAQAADGKTTLDWGDDAARANWGGKWRMPTKAEFDELLTLSRTWTTVNGINGYQITGNGNSIFLPAAGSRWNADFDGKGSAGRYWSSSLYEGYPGGAGRLYFYSNGANIGNVERNNGYTVRPVQSN